MLLTLDNADDNESASAVLLGDPSPPPTPNGQLAFAEPGLTRTPRSAPADVLNVTCSPSVIRPSISTSAAAPAETPSFSDARHSNSGSPTGSAAANNNNRRVSSQRPSSRRAKLSSILPAKAPAATSPNPPASCAGVNPRGSSNNASGFPRVSETIRPRTCSSEQKRDHRTQQCAGVAVGKPAHL